MARLGLLLLAAVGAVACSAAVVDADAAAAAAAGRTNVVLVGATGNLAKKYLFQALYDQAQMKPGLHVYPAATKAAHVGQPIIDATLAGNVSCDGATACTAFQDRVHPYVQLRNEEHWAALAAQLEADNEDAGAPETGRLVYLSIPPSVYAKTAKYINQFLRPSGGAWLRVIFEKPFGEDLGSAKSLARRLGDELAEEEIYRVDHYLGKAGVQAITQFRRAQAAAGNDQWETLLSNNHVSHVEIAMMETEDCAGRTGFYEQYGIIRDVLQNHLTEMATLVAMDLTPAGDPDAFAAAKMRVLEAIVPPDAHESVVGQYDGYLTHVRNDLAKWKTPEEVHAHERQKMSRTPTFGASELLIDNERWQGVPFLVLAGKQLLRREAFARIKFKNGGELRFQVQGDGGTYIQITGDLPAFVPPPTFGFGKWSAAPPADDDSSKLVLDAQRPAYWVVVDRALAGDRALFIGTEPLLKSWAVWTPLLDEYHAHRHVSLHIYSPERDTGRHLSDPALVYQTIEQNKAAVIWQREEQEKWGNNKREL